MKTARDREGDHDAFNLRPVFQNDPRGACVKLRLPSGRGNDFGGEWLLCVPA